MNCERNKFSAKKKVKNKNKNESLDRCMQSPIKHDEITFKYFIFFYNLFHNLLILQIMTGIWEVFLQPILQLENVTNDDRYEKYVYTPIDLI